MNAATRRVLLTTAPLAVACFLAAPGLSDAPEEQFKSAVHLLNEHQYAEAMALLERVLQAYPESSAALWNYGIAAAELGESERALGAWQRYRKVVPDDWRARAKLVQAYQALGRTAERDAERTELLKLRSSKAEPSLSEAVRFCREQFRRSGQKFFVFEYFRPTGERPVFYAFVAVDGTGEESYRISLSSYQSTNEILWEVGDLPRSKRLYHLDRYETNGHSTLAFYEFKPSYERVRADVLSHLDGRLEPAT